MTRSIGKRSLAVLLALILFGSLLPRVALPVSAEDSCSGSCGENLTWYYTCDEEYGSGILYIEGWGDMTNFEFFDPPWKHRGRFSVLFLLPCVSVPRRAEALPGGVFRWEIG